MTMSHCYYTHLLYFCPTACVLWEFKIKCVKKVSFLVPNRFVLKYLNNFFVLQLYTNNTKIQIKSAL